MDISQVDSLKPEVRDQALLTLIQSDGWAIVKAEVTRMIDVVQGDVNEINVAMTMKQFWKLKCYLVALKFLLDIPTKLKGDEVGKLSSRGDDGNPEVMIDEVYDSEVKEKK